MARFRSGRRSRSGSNSRSTASAVMPSLSSRAFCRFCTIGSTVQNFQQGWYAVSSGRSTDYGRTRELSGDLRDLTPGTLPREGGSIPTMPRRGEVLVAIINNKLDFAMLRERLWYRIPVSSANKWIKDRWPSTNGFLSNHGFRARTTRRELFRRRHRYREVSRQELFPDEPRTRSARRYHQVFVHSVQQLSKPIYSRRYRRIVFIPTTWEKFQSAAEINDLYDESSLEDRLWAEFKRHNIPAERQEFVTARGHDYALDFALYCTKGGIDVETDGDFWHANPEKAEEDNLPRQRPGNTRMACPPVQREADSGTGRGLLCRHRG